MQVMQEHHQNNLLRLENTRLRTENEMRNEALKNTRCLHCGGPVSIGKLCFNQNQLRIENSRLKAKVYIYIYVFKLLSYRITFILLVELRMMFCLYPFIIID